MAGVIRMGVAQMCLRSAGQRRWSGNHAMLIYALAAHAAERVRAATSFVVTGTFADALHLLQTRRALLDAIWKRGASIPQELRADMFFYDRFRGRSGQRINVAKAIADSWKDLLAMTEGETRFSCDGHEYALRADLTSSGDSFSLRIEIGNATISQTSLAATPIIRLPSAPRQLSVRERKDIELHFAVLEAALQRAAAEDSLVIDLKRALKARIPDSALFPDVEDTRAADDEKVQTTAFLPHLIASEVSLPYWRRRLIEAVVEPATAKMSIAYRQQVLPDLLIEEFTLNYAKQICLMEDVWARVLLRRHRRRVNEEMIDLIERSRQSYNIFLPIGAVSSLAQGSYSRDELYRRFEPIATEVITDAAKRLNDYLSARALLVTGGHRGLQRLGRRKKVLIRLYGWTGWNGRSGPSETRPVPTSVETPRVIGLRGSAARSAAMAPRAQVPIASDPSTAAQVPTESDSVKKAKQRKRRKRT